MGDTGNVTSKERAMSPLEIDTLAQKVASIVCERLANQPVLITKAELAKRTSLSRATIDRGIANGEIPFIRRGRRILFSLNAVVAAMSQEKTAS